MRDRDRSDNMQQNSILKAPAMLELQQPGNQTVCVWSCVTQQPSCLAVNQLLNVIPCNLAYMC